MITIGVWQWQQYNHHPCRTVSIIFTYKKVVIFIPVERVARGVCSARYCRVMLQNINFTFNIRVDIYHTDGTTGASDVDLFHSGCIADEV